MATPKDISNFHIAKIHLPTQISWILISKRMATPWKYFQL